jgi:hypothetical protein
MVRNLHLTIGTLLYLVAKPCAEVGHGVSDRKVIGAFQLDHISRTPKGMNRENQSHHNHQKYNASPHNMPPLV